VAKRLGLVIDQERCIGCEACTVACRVENEPSAGRWIRVETIGGARKDTPAGHHPDLKMEFLPQTCMHCADPPCADACPEAALVKRDDGPVVLDEGKCTGCQACIDACPYEAILHSEEKNLVEKCDLCDHRIDAGLEPFCVVCCEGQAIFFGDLGDPDSEVAQRVAAQKAYQLKPEAGTNPGVWYCPPKERRPL
jgi:Fe-S-cluster-containing dehydrogenase component